MSLQPSSNLDSWLKAFNAAIFQIISGNYSDFYCTPRLKTDGKTGIDGSTGTAANGHFWSGFYYFLSRQQGIRQPKVSPWFGLWNEDNGNFSIGIYIEFDFSKSNPEFIQRLIKSPHYGEHQKFITHHPNADPDRQLRCSFNDYMRMGYGKRAADSGFSLENWINSSTTQRGDLEDFFKTINAKFLVPHIQ